MPKAQLHNLTGAADHWALMACTAGLRVEERAEAVRDGFDLFKFALICRVRAFVDGSLAFVIEAGRSLSQRWSTFGMSCRWRE